MIRPPASAKHRPIDPQNIIVSGDSAGAGMVLALLVILRDQGLPMPSAASLISPWVDLTHSFGSVIGDASQDYIPADGFHFQPSPSWPPIKGDGITVQLNGKPFLLDEQVQTYVSNRMMAHPLVSLVNQGSLGGLPPLLIVCLESIF